MKDEFNGVKIKGFVGLESKMYLLLGCDDKEVNKAKGMNLILKHNEYVNVLKSKKLVRHKMKNIELVLIY